MTNNSLTNNHLNSSFVDYYIQSLSINDVQEMIYDFFLHIINKWKSEDVLSEFKRLFINSLKSELLLESSTGLYRYFSHNNELDFRHTLKRCCYILINNWESNRKYKYIEELISVLANYQPEGNDNSPSDLIIYRGWLENFINSKDYQELNLFAKRHYTNTNNYWVDRYSSFLIYAQSLDQDNPQEQQELARKIAKQMKDKFKFDLAMYTARSQSNNYANKRYENPTLLGDDVLRLIKEIVIKKGMFSYGNIANIFINQTKDIIFEEFKLSLNKYLIFYLEKPKVVDTLQKCLTEKFIPWRKEYNNRKINNDLFLRYCNRVIDLLTTENKTEPSPLFLLILSQGHPLTLVFLLLKIILISKNSRSHLEMRIADLIRFYEKYPEKECNFFINFLEFFNITFTIYAENVEYNLIPAKRNTGLIDKSKLQFDPDAYHVFSQLKVNFQA
ncbi:MAG: hypothetical protein HRU34_07660 [Richelia sp.]|nr:hypothetical protein [Richelia sp.]